MPFSVTASSGSSHCSGSSESAEPENVADGASALAPASGSLPCSPPDCPSLPVTHALKRLGFLCLQPIDLLHGAGIDVSKQRLRQLCASGIVGLALAAPPCGAFSLARLKPGGPRPVRAPQFPDGLPGLLPDSSASLLFLVNFTSSPENFCLWCPCVAGLSCSRIRHPVSLGRLMGLRPGCDSSRPLPCQCGGLCAWHGCV